MQIDRLGRLQVRQLHVQVIRRWSIGAISISTSCQKTPLFPYSKQLLQENFLPKLMLLLKKSLTLLLLYIVFGSVSNILSIFTKLSYIKQVENHILCQPITHRISLIAVIFQVIQVWEVFNINFWNSLIVLEQCLAKQWWIAL